MAAMSSRRVIVLILTMLLIAVPTAAIAHGAPANPTFMRHAPSRADAPSSGVAHTASNNAASIWPLVGLLLLAGLALGSRGSRRLRLVGLAILLMVGGYEGTIHSVHHLGDADAANQCRVASSNEHVNVLDVEMPSVAGAMLLLAYHEPPPAQPSRSRPVSRARDVGRAPPV
jgi:hypothetical protein